MPGTIEMLLDGEYVPRAAVRVAATPVAATPPPPPSPTHQAGTSTVGQTANPKAKTVASMPVTQAANVPKTKTVASTNPVQPTASHTLQSTSTGRSTTITRSTIPPAIPRKPQGKASAAPAKTEAPLRPVKMSALPVEQRAAQTEHAGQTVPSSSYHTYAKDVALKSGQTLGFIRGRGYYAAGRPTPAHQIEPPKASTIATTARASSATTPARLALNPQSTNHRVGQQTKARPTTPRRSLQAIGATSSPFMALQSNIAGVRPVVTLPSIPSLENLARKAALALLQDAASKLGLRATKAEIAFSLQPTNIGRAIPSLTLAASLFELEKLAAAPPYNVWGNHFDLTNGAPDAFLHAAYAGILTLRYGAKYASTLTTLHETGTPQNSLLDRNARTGDLHNNEVGIKLALAIEASPPPPSSEISIPMYGVADNRKEAELLAILFEASQPKSALTSGLVTVGPPGASETQVHRDPMIYSLDTGRRVRTLARK